MLCPLTRGPLIGNLWAFILIALVVTSSNFQVSNGSRRFLTGLIIGTLLARNGAPIYPAPASQPHYSPGPHHQQQPLFIIIPSASGKSYKPQVVPAAPYANTYSPPALDYRAYPHESNRRSLLFRAATKSLGKQTKTSKTVASWDKSKPYKSAKANSLPPGSALTARSYNGDEMRL